MSSTLAQIITRMLEYGFGETLENGEIDSLSSSAIVSLSRFALANKGPGEYKGKDTIVIRPVAASYADFKRYAGNLTVTTGSLAVDRSYADATLGTEYVRLLSHGIEHEWVVESVNKAQEDLYERQFSSWPLTVFADGDMNASGTTSYTGSAGTTLSKVTTASRTFGRQALRVQSDSTDDNAQSATVFTQPEEQWFLWAIASVAAGGDAELIPYDVTNSVALTSPAAPAHSEHQPHYMEWRGAVGATTRQLAVQLNAEEATGDIYWSALGGYPVSNKRIYLPSSINERMKVQGVMYARFGNPHPTQSGVYDAMSIDLVDIPTQDYGWDVKEGSEANPSYIQFHTTEWLGKPLFLKVRRSYADSDGLFTTGSGIDETETTNCPLDLIVPKANFHLFSRGDVQKKCPEYGGYLERANRELAVQLGRYTSEGPSQKRDRRWGYRGPSG